MKLLCKGFVLCAGIMLSQAAMAIQIDMHKVAQMGKGKSIGTISITETPYGLLFTPQLHGLTPGLHGFHVHTGDSCDNFGFAARGHFDPKNTGKHLGPYDDNGHLGDLPVLFANKQGKVTLPVLAPRLNSFQEIEGRALIIHAGGDNYSDKPVQLGGGGDRVACAVVPKVAPSQKAALERKKALQKMRMKKNQAQIAAPANTNNQAPAPADQTNTATQKPQQAPAAQPENAQQPETNAKQSSAKPVNNSATQAKPQATPSADSNMAEQAKEPIKQQAPQAAKMEQSASKSNKVFSSPLQLARKAKQEHQANHNDVNAQQADTSTKQIAAQMQQGANGSAETSKQAATQDASTHQAAAPQAAAEQQAKQQETVSLEKRIQEMRQAMYEKNKDMHMHPKHKRVMSIALPPKQELLVNG